MCETGWLIVRYPPLLSYFHPLLGCALCSCVFEAIACLIGALPFSHIFTPVPSLGMQTLLR